MSLTERTVRDAKPGPKTIILWDVQVKGLGLRVTRAGAKAYVLSYRIDGRKRLATIGRPSETSLRAVREHAGEMLSSVRAGDDPLARKEEAKVSPTVADGLDRFFNEYVPRRMADGRMSARTVKDYRKQADLTVLPALGKMKIKDVSRHDVERAIAPRAPVQRNRTLALISRLFTLFEEWEWRDQNSNPVKRIDRAKEEPRDRVLAPSELAALAQALDVVENRFPAGVAAIRFAAVTGLRIGEVRSIRWEHVNFETGRLVMPATKTGRRIHDLPAVALDILSGLPRKGEWAFMSRSGSPASYRVVHKAFEEAARKAGLVDVRLHDLRRTVMTSAAAAGVGTHVLRDLLGHKSTAMADRYIRAVGNPVREAREQVADMMAAAMGGK